MYSETSIETMKKIIISIFTFLIMAGLLRAEENLSTLIAAAEGGDAEAQAKLAVCYGRGDGVEQDYKKAFEWAMKAAKQGSAEGAFIVGGCYYQGKGVKVDKDAAIQYFEQAGLLGYTVAMMNLGSIYLNMMPPSYEKARRWFKLAAEKGDAEAQNTLAKMYLGGIGGEQNMSKALIWFDKSAEQGYADAEFELGNIYRKGIVVPKDLSKAESLYKRSFEHGYIGALNNLGTMYAEMSDEESAFKTFRHAAELGDVIGMMNVGIAYLKGKGVPRDVKQAREWFNKAEVHGYNFPPSLKAELEAAEKESKK